MLDLGGTGDFWSRSRCCPHAAPSSTFEANVDAQRVPSIQRDALRGDEIVADEEFELVFSTKLIPSSSQLGACGAGAAPGAPAIRIGPVHVPSVGTTPISDAKGCQHVA